MMLMCLDRAEAEIGVSDEWATRQEVEIITKVILEKMGVVGYTYYVVVCHYAVGAGVAKHTDSDYVSDCKWVVSITAWGQATFSIQDKGGVATV